VPREHYCGNICADCQPIRRRTRAPRSAYRVYSREHSPQLSFVGNVALHKFKALRQPSKPAGKIVVDNNFIAGTPQSARRMTADITCTACYQYRQEGPRTDKKIKPQSTQQLQTTGIRRQRDPKRWTLTLHEAKFFRRRPAGPAPSSGRALPLSSDVSRKTSGSRHGENCSCQARGA
jgi:hypothetical protein